MNQIDINSTSNDILAIADLHADEWRYYNNEPNERLLQPLIIADRLCYLGKELGIDTLLDLGDTFNKPKPSPWVCYVIEQFFTRLSKQFKHILVIYGQHDNLSRNNKYDPKDTMMTLMYDISPVIKYCHDTMVNYNGCNIYMSNYLFQSEIKIPDCDIFASHVSLGFGQTISGNYKLGVFGDIHTEYDEGKDHMVAPTRQLYPHQPDDPHYAIIHTDTCTFERKVLDGTCMKLDGSTYEHRFLRLKESRQYIDAMSRGLTSGEVTESSNLRSEISSNVYSDLESILTEQGLMDIHHQIDMTNAPQPISFNFKLLNLEAINFRSIEHLLIDFNQWDRVLYVSGENGNGKSSLIRAIITALVGDPSMKSFNRKVEGEESLTCCVKLKLSYNEHIYDIERGAGWTCFSIDGTEVSKSKRELENFIREELPFINYFNYLTMLPNHHYFDSIDRTQLIKTCFNLEIFDYIYYKACDLVSNKYNELNDINRKIELLNGIIESKTQTIDKYQSELSLIKLPEESESELNNEISEVTILKDNITEQYTQLMKIYNEIKLNNKNLGNLSSVNQEEVKSNIEKLNELDKLTDASNNFAVTVTDQSLKLNSIKYEFDKIKTEIDSKNKLIKSYEEQIEKLSDVNKNTIPCPKCGAFISLTDNSQHIEEIRNTIETLTCEVENFTSRLNDIETEYNTQSSKLSELKSEQEILQKTISDHTEMLAKSNITAGKQYYQNLLASLDSISDIKNKISELQVTYNELNTKYSSDLNVFNTKLNGVKFNEYITNITNKLSVIKEYSIKLNNITELDTEIKNQNLQINELKEDINVKNSELSRLQKYQALFNQKDLNSIPYKILANVVDSMSNDNIKFRSSRELANGNEKFEVSVSIKVKNKWIDYIDASDGQKCILDLFIVNRIVNLLGNVGILLMDEAVANVDSGKMGIISDFFNSTNTNKIIYTSHNESLAFGDSELHCELDDEGVTHFTWS